MLRLSASDFKIMAMASMAVAHFSIVVASYLPWGVAPLFDVCGVTVTASWLMAMVPRCAGMVVVAFLIGEGLRHTRNRWVYCLRLLLLALVSEIPFRLAFGGSLEPASAGSNTMSAMAAGAMLVTIGETESSSWVMKAMMLVSVIAAAWVLDVNGGLLLVGAVVAIYLAGKRSYLVAPLWLTYPWGVFYLPAFALLSCYDGTRGRVAAGAGKWLFYVFYPLHLLILWGIKMAVLG